MFLINLINYSLLNQLKSSQSTKERNIYFYSFLESKRKQTHSESEEIKGMKSKKLMKVLFVRF